MTYSSFHPFIEDLDYEIAHAEEFMLAPEFHLSKILVCEITYNIMGLGGAAEILTLKSLL